MIQLIASFVEKLDGKLMPQYQKWGSDPIRVKICGFALQTKTIQKASYL